MAYRGVQAARIRQNAGDILSQAGYTATWRQYVSASEGIAYAGLGETQHYREQTITALLYQSYQRQPEGQRAVGMLAAGEFAASTRERLGRQDELVWRGTTYRVESDPQPSHVAGLWMVTVKRGE
jgi:hypothetical protein